MFPYGTTDFLTVRRKNRTEAGKRQLSRLIFDTFHYEREVNRRYVKKNTFEGKSKFKYKKRKIMELLKGDIDIIGKNHC